MKKMIVAFLATGLMGSVLAQPVGKQPQGSPPATTTATVPGAQGATTQSLGDMTPFYVVGGAAILGAIIVASSGSNHKSSTPPPTGTTGTH